MADGDKTEKATPKRRQESRRKGQLPISKEVHSVFVLSGAIASIYFLSSHTYFKIMSLMKWMLRTSFNDAQLDIATFMVLFETLMKYFFVIIWPIMLTIVVAGVLANYVQIGFLFTTEPLSPKLSKLNPISGFKKLFSLRSVAELVKSMLKLLVVGGVSFLMVRHDINMIPSLVDMGCKAIFIFIFKMAYKIGIVTCIAMLVIAVLDFAYQKWQYEKDLMMTKEEVKDEMKQSQGDPQVKSRIRSIQIEMARHRMMEGVPTADVVITNPTRLAVALKYDSDEMPAPTVIAKGAGVIASRIKEIARDSHVPVVENKPLAQALFRSVDLGEVIPVELYKAVAEVLAYVYRLKSGNRYV